MLRDSSRQLNFYSVLFDRIPEDHILKKIDSAIDFGFINEYLEKSYCNRTKESGLTIKEAYGDKAYFRKPILDLLEEDNVEAIIPVSESVYRIDESKYRYNKDSDQWFCNYGNCTVSKEKKTTKSGRVVLEYKFEKEKCRNCPHREECKTGKSIAKRLIISINTPEFYEHNQKTKTEEFKEKYKKRASHEWKNGEMKRFHGLDRARGYGLKSVSIQAKLTAIVAN